jgi:hypothetical protein
MKEKLFAYLHSTFSESDGTGSSSRLLAGTGVLSAIVWVSYIVFKTHTLPDLSGASLWLGASFSGYGINKAAGCFSRGDKDSLDKT